MKSLRRELAETVEGAVLSEHEAYWRILQARIDGQQVSQQLEELSERWRPFGSPSGRTKDLIPVA